MNIADRAVGYFPLSISTSLALQGALGTHPDHPAGPKLLNDFNGHAVNVKTLFRNYYEAIGKDNIPQVSTKELIDGFREEISYYLDISEEQSGFSFKTFLYLSDYIGLESRLRHAIPRTDSTPIQILYTKTMKLVLGEIIKNEKELINLYTLKITEKLPSQTLILTHFPYDLTSRIADNMYLLESHTGAIKDRSKWHTKYYNGKDLAAIPFNEAFLSIFGDKQQFSPIGGAYRRALIELSSKYNWSFVTSKDKVLYGIDTLKDRYMVEKLRSFLKHW